MYQQPHNDVMMGYQFQPQGPNFANVRFRPPFIYQRQNYCSRLPITNTEHWCETCDRGFGTVDLLQKHLQQHQKCNIDGCQFVAHPKVVTKHIQMQHASGLYKKISKLNNPEEIKKWIEERKRRYPTKANIESKAAERKEKFDRGERMGLKSDGFKRNFKTGKPFAAYEKRKSGVKEDLHQRRQRPNVKKNFLLNKTSLPRKVHEVPPAGDRLRKLKPFAGIQDIIMRCAEEEENEVTEADLDIEDEDDTKLPNDVIELDKSKPKVCGALSSLMCDYESSEEEDIDEKKIDDQHDLKCSKVNTKLPVLILNQNKNLHDKNKEETSKDNETGKVELHKTVNTQESQVTLYKLMDKRDNVGEPKKSECMKLNDTENNAMLDKCTEKSDDESGPEEIKIIKPNDIEIVNNENKIAMEDVSRTSHKKYQSDNIKKNIYHHRKPKLRVPSTLLQKLLHREIQQERNIVLQCIRYVVDNNFFDKKVTELQEPE